MRRDYTITYGVMAVSRWLRPGEFAPAWQTKVLVNERVISLRTITIRALPRQLCLHSLVGGKFKEDAESPLLLFGERPRCVQEEFLSCDI